MEYKIMEHKNEEPIVNIPARNCKVLIVDDLAVNLLVVKGRLKSYNFLLDTAASGQEAIGLVQNASSPDERYDLIFMDHLMPEMDGVETTEAIRKIEGYADTPIIALTANIVPGMREFYLEHGFQDYLTKPISAELLDKVIMRWTPCHPAMTGNLSTTAAAEKPAAKKINITVELESQRLDMLNHYRVSFENRREFDTAYFERFTSLIESLDTEDFTAELHRQAALLIEAGKRKDAPEIRGTLPAFYGTLRKRRETNGQEDIVLEEILPRLKKAILDGKTETAENIISEMGGVSLSPQGRELYFLLYDLLLAGETEKAAGAIGRWESQQTRSF